jgi:hypothetical protein
MAEKTSNDSNATGGLPSSSSAQQQLRELHVQLNQLDDFIASDPSNDQYLQTRDDLLTVISMTENLIDAAHSLSDDEEHGDHSEGQNHLQQQHRVTELIENLHVGDHIEVISGERPYPAILLSINSSTSQCTLKYYEFGTEVTLSLHEIRKISGKGVKESEFLPDQVAPGLRCQCKYPPDQKWYDAKIESVTSDGYLVIFSQYGTTLEVPLEYLRHMRLSASRQQKRLSERHMEPAAHVVIPDNLKINPTDTEAVSFLLLLLLTLPLTHLTLLLSCPHAFSSKRRRRKERLRQSKVKLVLKSENKNNLRHKTTGKLSNPRSLSLRPPPTTVPSLTVLSLG